MAKVQKKINQLTHNRVGVDKTNLYAYYKDQFDYFLNPDVGKKNTSEMNQQYISDGETEYALNRLMTEPMDSVTALIGYQGIGKSTDICYSYKINNNAIEINEKNKTIIFPSFFNGYVLEFTTENLERIVNNVREELTKRIASVCSYLDEKFPLLEKQFNSQEGQQDFYEFLKKTNPKAMESISTITVKDRKEKMDIAKEDEAYIYIVTKLKYYLVNPLCELDRLLIIIDDIESLPYDYQEQLVVQYLRFYTCMRNLPNIKFDKDVYINVLISIRPNTYKLLMNSKTFSSYSISKEIYKSKGVDLSKYFTKKYSSLSKNIIKNDKDKWKFALNTLTSLSDKFDKKYSNMIKHLVCMDLRKVLKVYGQILSNTTWIIKEVGGVNEDNCKLEYVFNNITVIRALACGSNIVYSNNVDNLIPNVLYNTVNEDYSVLSLYIVAYFVKKHAGYWKYGAETVCKITLLQDLCDVFGELIRDKASKTVNYLFQIGILSTSILDKEVNYLKTASKSNLLYLSSKGYEIWSMLYSDSVLIELYREDYYQEFEGPDNAFRSSYDLMGKNEQIQIFIQLYIILENLIKTEEIMVHNSINTRSYDKYISIFGDRLMVEYLMIGIDKSIAYSGNKDKIIDKSEKLKELISNIKKAIKYEP